LKSVEAPVAESDEDPLQDPFASALPRYHYGRLGWRTRVALVTTLGLAGVAAVAGVHRARPRFDFAAARAAGAESKAAVVFGGACLCLFDVDRTLTGKQHPDDQCPGNTVMPGIYDDAFGGGDLTLSELGQAVKGTFCGTCHRGVVSAGDAGSPQEKAVLEEQLCDGPGEMGPWSTPKDIRSQFIIGCPNGLKAECARGIVDWFANEKGIVIPDEEVYFFDDFTGNTAGFADQGFNARQVSCESREGAIGLCGARSWEVVRAKGVRDCD